MKTDSQFNKKALFRKAYFDIFPRTSQEIAVRFAIRYNPNMTSNELRQKYLKFFEGKGHKIIPSAPLVPENDPSTLFISAGMQPLVPYLLGKPHPEGKRLVDCQRCIRTGDIDEVGDTFHHTFFEMLGNWSLGDYFKEDSIKWSYEFLTQELGIDPSRISVSVFAGDDDAPKDEQAARIWTEVGIPEDRIKYLGKEDNWWAAGPTGPCGPDTEIFVDGIEIWNNVFMVYNRKEDGTLEELPNKNVDTGMGLERALAVINGLDDNYKTDIFKDYIKTLEEFSGKRYSDHRKDFRIILDHARATAMLIADGIEPSNKGQGYILRRLVRRAFIKIKKIDYKIDYKDLTVNTLPILAEMFATDYNISSSKWEPLTQVIYSEISKFEKTLDKGLKEIEKIDHITGKIAFDLYQTYGFPLEVTEELAEEKGQKINEDEFKKEFEQHQERSRTASAGMFKGGLGSQGEMETKYHTATHLLHQALRTTLGPEVSQKGSNITSERLRFDFSWNEKLSEAQISQVEELVNQKIKEGLEVKTETMEKQSALDSGALAFFAEKYPDVVTVYSIGPDPSTNSGFPFSREICGGPHVKNTSGLGEFKIIKEEASSAGVRRIYATLT